MLRYCVLLKCEVKGLSHGLSHAHRRRATTTALVSRRLAALLARGGGAQQLAARPRRAAVRRRVVHLQLHEVRAGRLRPSTRAAGGVGG